MQFFVRIQKIINKQIKYFQNVHQVPARLWKIDHILSEFWIEAAEKACWDLAEN